MKNVMYKCIPRYMLVCQKHTVNGNIMNCSAQCVCHYSPLGSIKCVRG